MDKINVEIPLQAGAAVWHALSDRQVKGRVEARKHSKLSSEVRAKLTEPINTPQFSFKPGVIEVSREIFDYLIDIVDDKLDAGVPGGYGAGYGELIDAIEPYEGVAQAK